MAINPRPSLLGEIRQRLEVLVPAMETRQRLKEQVGGRVSDYDRDAVRLLRDLLAVLPESVSVPKWTWHAPSQGDAFDCHIQHADGSTIGNLRRDWKAVQRLLADANRAVLPQDPVPSTLEQLAAAQGVTPIEDLSALAMGESPIDDGTIETRLRTLAGELCKPECTVWMAEAAAVMVQEAGATITALQQQLTTAEGELRMIDAVMARRPALDQPTRWQNIEKALTWAGRADTAERKAQAAEARVSQLEQQIAWTREKLCKPNPVVSAICMLGTPCCPVNHLGGSVSHQSER